MSTAVQRGRPGRLGLSRELLRALLMTAVMLAIAGLAQLGRPIHKLADQRARVQLEEIVPRNFGDWRELKIGGVVLPDPATLANLARLYTQTLGRAYVNSQGVVVMLSIAYGDDQRAAMAVHYPEVCYPAQGFEVRSNRLDSINTAQGALPVRRLETALSGQRYEPVSYWVTIGDRVSLGGLERRLIELEYGLQRVVPDGLLFRVSTINRDSAQAFRDQDRFVADLMAHLPPASRAWLAPQTSQQQAATTAARSTVP
ncbi:MAG: EpsI family protein [Rubrivivax sp.]|nr:EpsI family protein [Rubrivivax sp.]